MPLAYIRPAGESGLYHIHYVDGHNHPDQGLPGMGGHPDQGLPGRPVRPDQGLPYPGGRPDQGLPGHGHPDHDLPHLPGIPDNSLPTTPPPTVAPGTIIVMVRGPDGKWKWASLPPGSAMPTPLPVPPPTAQPR